MLKRNDTIRTPRDFIWLTDVGGFRYCVGLVGVKMFSSQKVSHLSSIQELTNIFWVGGGVENFVEPLELVMEWVARAKTAPMAMWNQPVWLPSEQDDEDDEPNTDGMTETSYCSKCGGLEGVHYSHCEYLLSDKDLLNDQET